MRPKAYKIVVLTVQGLPLTFTVSEYSIEEGNFIKFMDRKTGEIMRFHTSRCEIKEVYTYE